MKTCKQRDRHVPALTCGYPLPCPHHSATIELTPPPTVTIPHALGKQDPNAKAVALVEIAEALAED